MADRNEEQLLNELLAEIREADALLSAADLQPRVVRAFESADWFVKPRASRGSTKQDAPYVRYAYSAGLATLAACVVAAFALWNAQPNAIVTIPAVSPPTLLADTRNTPLPIPAVYEETRKAPFPASRPRRSTANDLRRGPELEFVAVVPMTERELAGPFQIVRVQMPRASIGAWTSALEDPHELVQTDLLLGEDGMARAIRVSTEHSLSPWRSR